MLIKNIKLKDFRQFKGNKHEINFSTHPEKNVTVIIGENGTGKTTLAQAFSWCLYGKTTFETDVLCRSTGIEMEVGKETLVFVSVTLVHGENEYTISRSQNFLKESNDKFRKTHTKQDIFYKNADGQHREVKNPQEIANTMNKILPDELSRYFFFDGERIDQMSKEIRKGKSSEFGNAVKTILGLDTLTSALDHLTGSGNRACLMRSYNDSYNSNSQKDMDSYNLSIKKLQADQVAMEEQLQEKADEIETLNGKRDDLLVKIGTFAHVQDEVARRKNAENQLVKLDKDKKSNMKEMVNTFKKGNASHFMQYLIGDVLKDLENADKIDKGIPAIHKQAIEYLAERGVCLCGTCVPPDSEALEKLLANLQYIPPQSIGTLIENFTQIGKLQMAHGEGCLSSVTNRFTAIRDIERQHDELLEDLEEIKKRLEKTQDVSEFQKQLNSTEKKIKMFQGDIANLNESIGAIKPKITTFEEKRQLLVNHDDVNKKIDVYKAYVEYISGSLKLYYETQEKTVRDNLQKNINEIFRTIYAGGFSLSVDKDYYIQLESSQFEGNHNDVETSQAQSISIIFAFIAGVIKMAREAHDSEDNDLNTEPYPLVMDAPLSAFDKTRIQTVCDVLPAIAEQVIIFIKDTDGDLAEEHMANKIGKRYKFDKKNEFETYVVERGTTNV